jgi:hypothetical protein
MPATAHSIAERKAQALIDNDRIHEAFSSRVFISQGTRDTYATTILCIHDPGHAGHGKPFGGTCTCERARRAAQPIALDLCSHVIGCVRRIDAERGA